jgi:hypothetical protein
VPILVTVTVALGITAPDPSVRVPERAPEDAVCADATDANAKSKTTIQRTNDIVLITVLMEVVF